MIFNVSNVNINMRYWLRKTPMKQLIIYKKGISKTDFCKKIVNFAFKFSDDHFIWQKKKNSFKAKSL